MVDGMPKAFGITAGENGLITERSMDAYKVTGQRVVETCEKIKDMFVRKFPALEGETT